MSGYAKVAELVSEVERLRELVRLHRRTKWGLDGLVDGAIGEVCDEDDRELYRAVLKETS
ncbi:MAG: hypothetical protein V3W41_21865 [Planctomycetota bacterium]